MAKYLDANGLAKAWGKTKKYVGDSIASAVSTKADLVNGVVPSAQLPSFVDDVIEYSGEVSGSDFLEKILATPINTTVWIGATHEEAGDAYFRKFATNHTGAQDGIGIFSPEPAKIYVNLANMNTYRWSGTSLVEVSKSLALGETPSTAYAGDKGKANAEAIASLRSSKFDKAGGMITGDLRIWVNGTENASFYTVDQFLTKPTTIRADGNNDSASFLIENGKPVNKFFGTNKFIDGGNAEFYCPIRIDYGSYISFRDGFALYISWYNPWENTHSTVASYGKNDTSFYTPVIFEKGATSSASPTADASLTNKKYVDDSIASAVDKKLDKNGGTITGDLRILVNGTENAAFYAVDQFLLKPTTIKADGNQTNAIFNNGANGTPNNEFYGTSTFKSNVNIDGYLSLHNQNIYFPETASFWTREGNGLYHVLDLTRHEIQFFCSATFGVEEKVSIMRTPHGSYDATNKKYVDDSIASAVSTKADLVNGVVPSTQLPSYVDDVIEFNEQVDGPYWYKDAVSSSVAIGKMVFNKATASDLDGGASSPYYKKFLRKISEPDTAWESSPESHKEDYYGCMEVVAPENGKIYVSLSNEACYRWSGTNLVEISKSIALGETPSTAYAGDKGKANAEAIASLRSSKFDKAGGTITGATKVIVQGGENASFENGHNDFFGTNNFKGAVNCDGQIHLPSGANPTDGNCAVNKKYVDDTIASAVSTKVDKEYVDNAISLAITGALEGEY